MKNLISITMILLLSGAQALTQDLLWSEVTDTNNVFFGQDIFTDVDKNIYVGVAGWYAAYIIKYDSEGAIQAAMGDDENAQYKNITMDDNGRLYLVGNKTLNTDKDAMIMVFQDDGSPVFTQYYDYLGKHDEYLDVCIDAAGNIYVCGSGTNMDLKLDLIVGSYTPGGTPRWFKHYEQPMEGITGNSIKLSSDGELHVVCTKINIGGDYTLLSLVYSTDGVLLSEYSSSLPGYTDINPTFSLLDEDNNHFIGGYAYGADKAAFLMRLTDNAPVWTYVLSATGDTASFENGCFDADGNIICCGQYANTSHNAYFARFSPAGGLLDEGFYDSPSGQEAAFFDVAATDEYIYFCGAMEGLGTYSDMLSIKVDYSFTRMWDIIYNSFDNDSEIAYGIDIDPDGNVVMTGLSVSATGYVCRTWKYTNPLGVDELPGLLQGEIDIYPNPAAGEIHFSHKAESGQPPYTIYNLKGQVANSGTLQQGPEQLIDISALQSGAYMLIIYDGSGSYSGKFVKK